MQDILARDRAVIWHPFSPLKYTEDLIPIVKGTGASIFDADGKEYIDAISSWWVSVHGHAHPHIAMKLAEQALNLEHVIFAGFTHPWAVELCERLLRLLPAGQAKAFFSDNGSTAVEVALKMALQFWWNGGEDRKVIVALENAYHGDTVGAMSAGGRGSFTGPFESILFDVIHIPAPSVNNNDVVRSSFIELCRQGNVAAFIYEPVVQGAGGMVMYDIDGMNDLLEIAREHGVLLIADEVMTGFGRTGKLFASEYFDTMPDIICLSKALTGGTLPMAITTCSQHIHDRFVSDDRKHTFFHGHSFTGNPLGCAASLASLDLVEAPSFMENVARVEASHRRFMEQLQGDRRVRNVRLCGTILAFEVNTESPDSYFNDLRDKIYRAVLKHKVLLRPLGNTVYILPPVVITDEQLEKVYEAIMLMLDECGIQ